MVVGLASFIYKLADDIAEAVVMKQVFEVRARSPVLVLVLVLWVVVLWSCTGGDGKTTMSRCSGGDVDTPLSTLPTTKTTEQPRPFTREAVDQRLVYWLPVETLKLPRLTRRVIN